MTTIIMDLSELWKELDQADSLYERFGNCTSRHNCYRQHSLNNRLDTLNIRVTKL